MNEMDVYKSSKITIVSESLEKSTNNVLEWLHFYNQEFERCNVDNSFNPFALEISNVGLKNIPKQKVWNRRGYKQLIPKELQNNIWTPYLKRELFVVTKAVETIYEKNYIGSYGSELTNNKLLNLQLAVEAGFIIPATIVTNNKMDLLNFTKLDRKYITKSLQYTPYLETQEYFYQGSGTHFLNLKSISDTFASSLTQEYVEKEVEIRIFFIKNNYYAMAIFSQNDEQTKIDFRNYNLIKPNRTVPFHLPKVILSKLKRFSKLAKCNTGSIDLILTPTNDFVFLEINPMGQYQWLSENCNYFIDKNIAKILSNE